MEEVKILKNIVEGMKGLAGPEEGWESEEEKLMNEEGLEREEEPVLSRKANEGIETGQPEGMVRD